MKKKMLAVVFFLIFLFSGDRLAAVVLHWLVGLSNMPIPQLYAGRLDHGIVLLGNSRAYRHFPKNMVVDEFNSPVINLTYPGISSRISIALLEDYIDKYGPPKLVIAEVSDLLLDQQMISSFRHYTGRSDRLAAILEETYPDLFHAGLVSHIFNFNNPMFLNSLHKILFPLPDLRLEGSISVEAVRKYLENEEKTVFEIIPANRQSFSTLPALARQYGFELRLIVAPFLADLVEPKVYDEWRYNLSLLTGGHPVWDYGLSNVFGRSHFHDRNHLNVEGVEVFVALLRHDGFFKKNIVDAKRS